MVASIWQVLFGRKYDEIFGVVGSLGNVLVDRSYLDVEQVYLFCFSFQR